MKAAFNFTSIEKTDVNDQYKISGRVLVNINLDTCLFILGKDLVIRIDKIIFYGVELKNLQEGCACDLIINTKLSMTRLLSTPYLNEYLYVE